MNYSDYYRPPSGYAQPTRPRSNYMPSYFAPHWARKRGIPWNGFGMNANNSFQSYYGPQYGAQGGGYNYMQPGQFPSGQGQYPGGLYYGVPNGDGTFRRGAPLQGYSPYVPKNVNF